jgi:hypothetical protein
LSALTPTLDHISTLQKTGHLYTVAARTRIELEGPVKPKNGSKRRFDPDSPKYRKWRKKAASALFRAGFFKESEAFEACGVKFDWVRICSEDLDHDPKAIPHTCHLRWCPECERRAQARKLLSYVPGIWDVVNDPANHRPGYSLKKFELTTPYSLEDPEAPALFVQAWKNLQACINRLFLKLLDHELSPEEKRRGRVDLVAHKIGLIVQAEFGEDGRKLHYHILMYGPYIPQSFLSDTWREVTAGECYVTHIRKIEDDQVEDAVKEQVKYVTKFNDLPANLVPQLARVLAGSRRTRRYGLFFTLPAVKPKRDGCPICGGLQQKLYVSEYLQACKLQGKTAATDILKRLDEVRTWNLSKSEVGILQSKHGNKSGEAQSRENFDPDAWCEAVLEKHLRSINGFMSGPDYSNWKHEPTDTGVPGSGSKGIKGHKARRKPG